MSKTPDVLDSDVLDELSDRSLALYQERLKAILEPEQNGRTVAIHLTSGNYALAQNSSEARRDLRSRQQEGQQGGPIVTLLVGPNQMGQLARRILGGQFLTGQPK